MKGNYPDDWYRGAVGFSDRLIAVDVSTGETSLITEDMGGDVDGVNLVLSEDEKYIIYTNKKMERFGIYASTLRVYKYYLDLSSSRF